MIFYCYVLHCVVMSVSSLHFTSTISIAVLHLSGAMCGMEQLSLNERVLVQCGDALVPLHIAQAREWPDRMPYHQRMLG